jgi:tRNA threonylcarbamoyladenosine biosynthesis protein TsaE
MSPAQTATARARRTVLTRSATETQDFAAALAAEAHSGDRLALIGSLGAGKTQFAKGFARGLGVAETVNSPSFTLQAEYRGRLPLFHQDLFRLAGATEALDGGLFDERQDQGVTLSEWADRLEAGFDPDRLEVRITTLGETERAIELAAPDAGQDTRYQRYLQRAARWDAHRLTGDRP